MFLLSVWIPRSTCYPKSDKRTMTQRQQKAKVNQSLASEGPKKSENLSNARKYSHCKN